MAVDDAAVADGIRASDADQRTVAPFEQWLEAHRHLWSPNTVRGYTTSLAQWWTFLGQHGDEDRWQDTGVVTVFWILGVAT